MSTVVSSSKLPDLLSSMRVRTGPLRSRGMSLSRKPICFQSSSLNPEALRALRPDVFEMAVLDVERERNGLRAFDHEPVLLAAAFELVRALGDQLLEPLLLGALHLPALFEHAHDLGHHDAEGMRQRQQDGEQQHHGRGHRRELRGAEARRIDVFGGEREVQVARRALADVDVAHA